MNIFEKIVDLFKKFWEWLKSLFCGKKRNPLVKITILTIFFMFFTFDNSYAQRTDLQAIMVYFYQPRIANNDYWTVNWHNGVAESIDIYKNDTLRVKIKNEQGQWVNWIDIPQELDTMTINLRVSYPYNYNVEFTFDLIAKDTLGIASDPSDSVRVYFMVSDINKIDDPDSEQGYYRGDEAIDGLDLIELSKNWGRTGLGYFDREDITGDGNIDGLDLLQVSRDWGKTWSP